MAGNTWNWCNDWYDREYYHTSPSDNPRGPETGMPMPDGKPYRCLRGGSWYNATRYPGDHSRVSNRDPAYYRGPGDPNGPWFQISFRVARPWRQGAGASENGSTTAGGRPWAQSPFRQTTRIRFTAPVCGPVRLVIADLAGRSVRQLLLGEYSAGEHSLTWDGKDDAGRPASPGVYMCRLSAGSASGTAKLLKLE
jgi:hypothetical protein